MVRASNFLPALFVLTAAAQAQPSSVQSCTSCHGANGQGGSTGAPRLAGQPQAYLVRQLEAYASGQREHSVMTPIAKGLRPQEREAIAAYYARLPVPPTPPQLGGEPGVKVAVFTNQAYFVRRND